MKDVNHKLLPTDGFRFCTQAVIHILNGERSEAESAIALAESDCSGDYGAYPLQTLARLRKLAEALS